MFSGKGSFGIVWALVVAGLSEAIVACGEEFTCGDTRSCSSAIPDGGNKGGSSGVGGGSMGSAGAMGSAGSVDSAAGNGGEAGSAGARGDGGPDSDAASPDARSCEAEMPSTELGVFVSNAGQDGADGAVCGTRESPCKTIGKALSIATAGRIVYLAAGTYEEDGLALKAGVTLQGGWDRSAVGVWSRVCTPERSSSAVVRAKTADRSLSAVDLAGVATLDTLTIRSKIAPPTAGQSLYGIVATGTATELVIREVAIEVGAGGGGAPGAVGQDGAAPLTACNPGTGSDGSTAGGAGSGAPNGAFSSNGYLAAPGVAGGIGSDGNHGAAAAAAPCIACPNSGAVCEGRCVGQPICALRCSWSSSFPSCGVAGTNGCGGGGGKGGEPGSGGGSSVGVFLWNAKLHATSGRISSGRGGDGGPGGSAGRGKVGSAGAAGRTGSSCLVCEGIIVPPGACPQPSSQAPSAGDPGGIGGAGKDGGPGGGGSGGHSYAIYKGGAAVTDVAPGVALVVGLAGVGGAATSRGTDGSSRPIAP